MSFSEDEAVIHLQQLDNSQGSVERTSKWFMTVKDNAKEAVKLWFKEFRRAPPKKKIAFLHLANDVIQNGMIEAPQYGKLFEPVLPTAFKETAKVQRHSVRAAVAHLLIVWASRRVYSKSFLRQLRFICQRAVAEADTPGASEEIKKNIIAASPFAFSFSTVLAEGVPQKAGNADVPQATGNGRNKRRRASKPQLAFPFAPSSNTASFAPADSLTETAHNSLSAFREELARELQTEAIPPPKTSELIELLEKLQQPTASGDAATRRAIAQFPPEVSDSAKAMEILKNASDAERRKWIRHIADCETRLSQYNEALEDEANERHKFGLKLRAYRESVREKLIQYDSELQDLKAKHAHGVALQQELSKHMSNLPDLNLLPDMTAGLDPLPTISDLFG